MTAVLSIPRVERKMRIGPPSPVQICQLEFELNAVLELYKARKPKRVLEIGTFCGGTLFHLLQNATEGATVVTVDSLVDAPDNRHLFPGWTPDGVECVPIVGDSHDPDTIAQVAEHGPFEFIFIDGLHTYDAVSRDYADYSTLAAPGAVIGLHDIRLVRDYPDGETAGVSRLWREIQEAGAVTQEIVCTPGQSEYGIGIVYAP